MGGGTRLGTGAGCGGDTGGGGAQVCCGGTGAL